MLTTKQVAERYGVDASTVRRWCEALRFPNAQKFGRDWLIPESDVEGFTPPTPGNPNWKKPISDEPT